MATMNDKPAPTTPVASSSARRRWIFAAIAVVTVIGTAYGSYWALVLRNFQSTDDAYVNGNVVPITPQVSGTVVAIAADDTQFVPAGQPLVRLDDSDAKVALDQAEAQLGKTVREVRNLFATTAQLSATVEIRESDVARAQDDVARRERLAGSGAVSGEELQHAHDALNAARAALLAAQQQLEANRARIDRTGIDTHPDVQNAAAGVHEAYLGYARTAIPAPISGYVAKRAVQLGQRVSPGTPLMAIVPLDQVWVDANFKEAQLADMRVGQPVSLHADLYGGKVDYHGQVVGFGAGTGSAFAVLPAQNATGNWIKVVQRVPVRIALDPVELASHPLQIGLSMQAEVDTRDHSGDRLPQLTQATPAYSTDVFRSLDDLANDRVKAVIAANEASPRKLARVPGRQEGASDDPLGRGDRARNDARLARAPARDSP